MRRLFASWDLTLLSLAAKDMSLNKLGSLKPEDLKKVREAFKENAHPRFMKEFFYNKAYGKAKLFKEKVGKADFEKLAKLVKIVGLLLQTKVYLLWNTFQSRHVSYR